ncbi:MAG: hypothetical protein ABJM06_02240 [Gilvibacter sp.]
MATYKKRGHKPKTKVEKQAQIEQDSTTAEVFNTLDQGASKTEAWVAKNQNIILGVIGAIAIIVLGFLGYQEYIQKPKEQKALNEMTQAQTYWEQALTAQNADSLYTLSLNGGGGQYGFLEIIEKYGATNAGNLAQYYAGVAYLNKGEYQNAINHLDAFKGDDAIIAPRATAAIGDAFNALDQKEQALEYYAKAAKMASNEFSTPQNLLKAARMALDLGKASEAMGYLQQIKDSYTNSAEATQAELYMGMAEAMQ